MTDVLLDGTGRRARGVRYLDAALDAHEVSARHVILAGGAFETPRLLLRTGLGNPDVVGRHLQFHFQTYVLGMFPERLHGHRGRSVTHLMDDPIVPDDLAQAAAREAGLPFIRGGIVEHGAAGHPILEGIHLPHGELHSQLMLDSMTRDCMAVFTMQGEDLPQVGNRIDLDPTVRDAYGLPAGRVTYAPHRHEVRVRRALGAAARGRDARRRRDRDVLDDVSPAARLDGRPPRRAHAHLAPHHGRRPHGRGPGDERVRSLAAPARRGERGVHRLVGVPDLDRLRPDAHDRRPRHPCVARPRRPRPPALHPPART